MPSDSRFLLVLIATLSLTASLSSYAEESILTAQNELGQNGASDPGIENESPKEPRPDDKRPDNLQLIAAYTLNNQAFLSLSPEIYFNEKNRWSAAAFAGAGDVFQDVDEIQFDDLKLATGAGIRYAISKDDKINLRVDLGVSRYGIFSYILFQESF